VDVKETNAKIEKYKAEHQDIIASKSNKKVIDKIGLFT
jgi:dipeptidase